MNVFSSAAGMLRRFVRRSGDFKRRRRFAVRVVNLSSLSVVGEVRGRWWVLAALAASSALLFAAAVVCGIVYTPARDLLPARLQSGLRADYEALWARVDSASERIVYNDAYARNIMAVLFDSVSAPAPGRIAEALPLDSLAQAGEAERGFVRRFEEAERYNLSVLAPVAASGMVFFCPVGGAEWSEAASGDGLPYVHGSVGRGAGVSAAYRGTVVALWRDGAGWCVMVQHPNDFVSVYRGLADVYVGRGDRVETGSRLGAVGPDGVDVELWHGGAALSPGEYLGL